MSERGKDDIYFNRCRPWTKDDDAYIVGMHGVISPQEVSLALGRTVDAVYQRCKVILLQDRWEGLFAYFQANEGAEMDHPMHKPYRVHSWSVREYAIVYYNRPYCHDKTVADALGFSEPYIARVYRKIVNNAELVQKIHQQHHDDKSILLPRDYANDKFKRFLQPKTAELAYGLTLMGHSYRTCHKYLGLHMGSCQTFYNHVRKWRKSDAFTSDEDALNACKNLPAEELEKIDKISRTFKSDQYKTRVMRLKEASK